MRMNCVYFEDDASTKLICLGYFDLNVNELRIRDEPLVPEIGDTKREASPCTRKARKSIAPQRQTSTSILASSRDSTLIWVSQALLPHRHSD
jgi:hypothetical protein